MPAIAKQRIWCVSDGCRGKALKNSDHCRACWAAWWKGLSWR